MCVCVCVQVLGPVKYVYLVTLGCLDPRTHRTHTHTHTRSQVQRHTPKHAKTSQTVNRYLEAIWYITCHSYMCTKLYILGCWSWLFYNFYKVKYSYSFKVIRMKNLSLGKHV